MTPIDPDAMKSQPKTIAEIHGDTIDAIAKESGFPNRHARKGPGRMKSPRTQQVHAKVMPPIATEIATEAARRGVTQGVLIEEAWQLHKDNRK